MGFVRNLVPVIGLMSVFGCTRYLGHTATDAAPPSGEHPVWDGSIAERAGDGGLAEGIPTDAAELDLARLDGPSHDADGAAGDGPGVDLPPPSCLSWTNDWTCDHSVSGYTCVASCGANKILCDNNKDCTCNGTVSCGWHAGAGCPVCSSAFQSGCCQ